MSYSIAKILEHPAIQVRNYAEKIAKDIPDQLFASKARVGEKAIDAVHPTFVFGHLSLYPTRILKFLSMDASEVLPPQSYYDLFQAGVACIDDPELSIYPAKAELVSRFLEGTDLIITRLRGFSDELLTSPNTEERSRDRFPLLGSFVAYLLTAHPNSHLGQISTWRRCVGLGPV